jgi:hypothetical protein
MKMRSFWRSAAPAPTAAPARDAGDRRGFALPMAILVIAFLTATISAAYTATSSELVTNMAQRGESKAYMVAQAGLENFMARRNEVGFCALCGIPPTTTYESTTVALPGGYAQVVAQRIRTGNNTRPGIYLLRARGVDTSSRLLSGASLRSSLNAFGSTGGDSARAARTVAQLVYWNVNQVNVLSGWTATNGLDKVGSSGTISGVDNCGKKAAVAGIAVPDGDYGVNGSFTPSGNPPVQYLGTQEQTNAAVRIDWNGVVNGNRIQPDYLFTSNQDAQNRWPWPAIGTNVYPVVRVNGDFNLPLVGGQGTLIVMGDLKINGNNLWKGIILVGGTMDSDGNGTMLGATMSGLNTMLTPEQLAAAQAQVSANGTTLEAYPARATANGTKTFQYDSCQVANAAGGLASYSVYPNAWMDNFVTY